MGGKVDTSIKFISKVQDSDKDQEPYPLMKPALASVVLCSQYQMERWSEKKLQLESDLENVKRMVESSLTECGKRYDSQYEALFK